MLPGENLARFYELRGRRVVEGGGALWYSTPGRMFMSLPYHLCPDPGPPQLDHLLWRTCGLGVRFPSQHRPGLPSGLYVCRDKRYGIQSVSRHFRGKVRQGLRNCEFRAVEPEELRSQGLEICRQTMQRQGRFDPEFGEERSWTRLVNAICRAPSAGAFGAFVGGRLSAFVITCREGAWLYLLHHFSRTADLELHPNHALSFELTRRITLDPDLDCVSMGIVSLNQLDGLHQYKLYLGYEVDPQNSVIQMHPALARLLAGRTAARMAEALRRRHPENQSWDLGCAVLEGARLSRRQGHAAPLVPEVTDL